MMLIHDDGTQATRFAISHVEFVCRIQTAADLAVEGGHYSLYVSSLDSGGGMHITVVYYLLLA